MKTFFQILTAFVPTVLLSCTSHSNDTKNFHSTDTINHGKTQIPVDTPRSFVKNYGANDSNRLFVFIGQKVWVEPLPSKRSSFDKGFKAKYVVIEKVFGDFPLDTIEFVAYDHYGSPAFSRYQNVLLYVSADSGTYYQQKYMYNDVYKTKDGRWAGTYAVGDYRHEYNKHTKIRPVKIEFAEKVAYPTKMTNDDNGQQFTLTYPKPYFKTVGDSAYAVYGNYVDDLFKLKRDGVLTARGLFGDEKLHIK